jgi:hypothetical protein
MISQTIERTAWQAIRACTITLFKSCHVKFFIVGEQRNKEKKRSTWRLEYYFILVTNNNLRILHFDLKASKFHMLLWSNWELGKSYMFIFEQILLQKTRNLIFITDNPRKLISDERCKRNSSRLLWASKAHVAFKCCWLWTSVSLSATLRAQSMTGGVQC